MDMGLWFYQLFVPAALSSGKSAVLSQVQSAHQSTWFCQGDPWEYLHLESVTGTWTNPGALVKTS